MKKLLLINLLFAVAFMLIGCNNTEREKGEATIFDVTGACPIRIDMTVDGDGKILEVKLEEYLSIYDIGSYGAEGDKATSSDPKAYAKYVRVGDKTFEYIDGRYFCDGQDYADYIAFNGAEYIYSLSKGDFDIVDEEGKDMGLPFDVYDKHRLKKTEWADKMKNGYHEGVEYSIGWKEDIYNLIQHLKNHGFYGYTGKEQAGKSGTFKVGKYDTLVSQTNFHGYMRAAKRAYDAACDNLNNTK